MTEEIKDLDLEIGEPKELCGICDNTGWRTEKEGEPGILEKALVPCPKGCKSQSEPSPPDAWKFVVKMKEVINYEPTNEKGMAELAGMLQEYLRQAGEIITSQEKIIDDVRLELSCPETLECANKNEPLYMWAALITSIKITQQQRIAELEKLLEETSLDGARACKALKELEAEKAELEKEVKNG